MSTNTLRKYVGPLLIAAVVVTATGGVVDGANPGDGAGSPTKIDSCTKITEPGRYVLTSDVKGTNEPCLVVDADGVILDGKNHSVTQTDASSTAVRIKSSNVTVRNVSVTGGVEYRSGEGSVSRVSSSGGKLFVDAHRKRTSGGTSVQQTVRVSGGSSSSSSSSSVSVSSSSSGGSSSVNVASFRSSNRSASAAFDGAFWEDDESFPSLCGRQWDDREAE